MSTPATCTIRNRDLRNSHQLLARSRVDSLIAADENAGNFLQEASLEERRKALELGLGEQEIIA